MDRIDILSSMYLCGYGQAKKGGSASKEMMDHIRNGERGPERVEAYLMGVFDASGDLGIDPYQFRCFETNERTK